ncbi:MAG TPA: hypothetical protein PKX27_04635 [Bacteroidales bacterium]|nr:hypothetical protein [Bacteroidales bacterium]HOX73401.1 hypothetical protein [Bacteroidales bacterium]HPM87249.1 hypothetical protein [Bacteroidales bacterium]HQM68519.1 hypothetical protein [Bacteroidales bacterium]
METKSEMTRQEKSDLVRKLAGKAFISAVVYNCVHNPAFRNI